jgi:hypothetical protein
MENGKALWAAEQLSSQKRRLVLDSGGLLESARTRNGNGALPPVAETINSSRQEGVGMSGGRGHKSSHEAFMKDLTKIPQTEKQLIEWQKVSSSTVMSKLLSLMK